jgi:4-amino-4-deoxy-L-arabinose transferase and related glycosyltransferases of PMT family
VWLLAALVPLAVVLPLVVGALAGALEIPRNDDWSYRRIAIDMARTGRLALDGICAPIIIGQTLFTQPFLWLSGLQAWAFTVVGVIFAVGAILSAYALARQLLPAREAALAAALLALFPGYLAYATSFMSDVPALAAQFLCLALGALAIRRRPTHMGLLLVSVAVGVFGFSIREFAVAAPASVLVAALIAERGRPRIWGLGIAVAACCAAIYLWKSALPGQLSPVDPGYGAPGAIRLAISTVAFVLSPAAIIAANRWHPHWKRVDVVIGAEVGGLLVAARLLEWHSEGSMPWIILNNLASQYGAPAPNVLDGYRPLLFTDGVWMAVNCLALGATVVVLAIGAGITGAHLRRTRGSLSVLLERLGSNAGILLLFALAVGAGLMVFALSRPIHDRYFWPLIPPVAALFLYVPGDLERSGTAVPSTRLAKFLVGSAAAFGGVLALISLIFMLNANAFDAARWRAGEELVRFGIPADEIDAGYEWMGFHATSPGDPARLGSTDPFYRFWWPAFRECGLVSSKLTDRPDAQLVGTTEYALHLVTGPVETLYLYRLSGPGCE